MQNATLLFLEGQKGQEFKMNKHKKNEERRNRKACKRFRWNQFKHQKCLGRKGRSPKSNVTSKYVQKLKPAIMCLLCRLERAHMVHQGLQHLRNVHKWQVRKDPPWWWLRLQTHSAGSCTRSWGRLTRRTWSCRPSACPLPLLWSLLGPRVWPCHRLPTSYYYFV